MLLKLLALFASISNCSALDKSRINSKVLVARRFIFLLIYFSMLWI